MKLEMQKKKDAEKKRRKRKTDELQKKTDDEKLKSGEKVILIRLLEVSPQEYQTNNA